MNRPTASTRAADRVTNTASGEGEVGLQPEETIAAAWRELRARGHRVSLRGVRRLYALHQLRVDRGDFLPWLLTYADTTGETAVWKVVAGGASA